jgi:hypothetical protein
LQTSIETSPKKLQPRLRYRQREPLSLMLSTFLLMISTA